MLPEDDSLDAIHEFFAELGFSLVVHRNSPPEPSEAEWRAMSREIRNARKALSVTHWADLRSLTSESVAPWYGGGNDEGEAIRSARRRWRIEEEGAPQGPRHLP